MLLTLLLASLASAQVPQGALTVKTEALTARLTSAAGWTITTLDYGGYQATVPAGGQGAVISEGGTWYGSAMEGGERVRSLALLVDGEEKALEPGATVEGGVVRLRKASSIGSMDHRAELSFDGDLVIHKHEFTATRDTTAASFYAFIYSVTPQTTDWLAQPLEGDEVAGEFCTSKQNLVNENVLWLAQYDRTARKGVLFYYITPFGGPGARTSVWDQTNYHKFFSQPCSGDIRAGTELSYQMVMKLFSVDADDWQGQVRAQVAELQERFPQQTVTRAASRLYDEGVPEEGMLTVQTAQYKIVFAAHQAWTIYSFEFDGKPIGPPSGFYGTVLIPTGGKWIGTGHTEGGREIVHGVKLLVDDVETPLEMGATVKGHRVTVVKDSTIHKFRAKATITVTDEEVIERQELVAEEDMELSLMYLFMHCWADSTTRWLAGLPDGETIEGELDGEGNSILKDVRWAAEYEPEMGISILAYTPTVITGPGSYCMIWEVPGRYNKLYFRRTSGGEQFPRGTALDYTVVVRGVAGETGDWKATKAAAADLARRFPTP